MNVEQMKLVLKGIITKTDLTPCVVGHRGVGKTAGIIQMVRELGRRYVSLRLGQMEVGDLVGIPFREGSVMHWSRPSWWPGDDEPETVIHCDELNRAQQEDTLQAIFQFVEPPSEGQRRALHTHHLSPRHKVIVTINPPDGTYQVATLDRALIDRMVMLYVESDHACWARYAAGRGLDEGVRQFLSGNSHMLVKKGDPLEMDAEPTERGWEMVSLLRQRCRFPEDLEMEVYAGIVGREAAVMFLRWCAENRVRPLGAEEVLDRWEEVADRAGAQRDDLQAITVNELTAYLQSGEELPLRRGDNLVSYISVLPRDLRFGFVKSLLKIPTVAQIIADDRHDAAVFDAIAQISRETA